MQRRRSRRLFLLLCSPYALHGFAAFGRALSETREPANGKKEVDEP